MSVTCIIFKNTILLIQLDTCEILEILMQMPSIKMDADISQSKTLKEAKKVRRSDRSSRILKWHQYNTNKSFVD